MTTFLKRQSSFGLLDYSFKISGRYYLKNVALLQIINGIPIKKLKIPEEFSILIKDRNYPVLVAIKTKTLENTELYGFLILKSHLFQKEEEYYETILQRHFLSDKKNKKSSFSIFSHTSPFFSIEYEKVILFSGERPKTNGKVLVELDFETLCEIIFQEYCE